MGMEAGWSKETSQPIDRACVNPVGSESWQVLAGSVSGESLCPRRGGGWRRACVWEGTHQREGGVLL